MKLRNIVLQKQNQDLAYKQIIKKASEFHNDLLNLNLFVKGSPEIKIRALETIAFFNTHSHTGRFTSAKIDERVKEISDEFFTVENNPLYIPVDQFNNRKILHIATALGATGGHTRLLENIARFEYERGSENILLVTGQKYTDLPERIRNNNELFAEIICFDTEKYIDRAISIREKVKEVTRVYNSQHPNDIITSIAVNFSPRPEIVYVNHADHLFWVGASFCDTILNIRPFAQKLSLGRRNNNIPSPVLPIKMDLEKPFVTKKEARSALGIADGIKVLLTISEFYKVTPDKHYNFFEILKQISEENKGKFIHYFIGVTPEEYYVIMGEEPPPEIICTGRIENPLLYQCAADLYLEGMPLGSFTAIFESVYCGAYPILMWGPYYIPWAMDSELYFKNIIEHPVDRNQYIDNIKKFLFQKDEIISEEISEIQDRIRYYNSSDYWSTTLNSLEKAEDSEFIEFDTDVIDLRIAETLETVNRFYKVNMYYEILKSLKKEMSTREIITLWIKYILTDRNNSLVMQLRMLKRFFY